MEKKHTVYYFFEASILGFGFLALLILDLAFMLEIIALSCILLFYIIMGLIHHKVNHDIHVKIVLEYILISVLIFSLFLFFKSGTI